MKEGRLSGKAAWISGATSGIGKAAAELFAEEGAAVALIGRRVERSLETVSRICDGGGKAIACACDVSREEDIATSIAETVDCFGGLDIIVNNAGMVEVKSLDKYSSDEWDYLMAVNVKSMFFAAKYGMPYLTKNPESYIVNVGSISSFVGQALTPVYTTSKHAVLGLTRSIALDYAAQGIRCNCVCPGITLTPMLEEHLEKTGDADLALRNRLKRVPLGKSLTPRDVAKSILYFSCDDSAGITGTSLVVDSGYLTAAEWNTDAVKGET
ncbi:MAG: SDR family oxidoreductase [Spirochaetales bacterium]|jgi:NAD(P)-dependent dehydrogenase (short-subunit alcohol dehydrogenase family)|nr:SDR family oxidoreductase [Spirochaetales bacterium]